MRLSTGDMLSHYEIVSQAGAGGMGEVAKKHTKFAITKRVNDSDAIAQWADDSAAWLSTRFPKLFFQNSGNPGRHWWRVLLDLCERPRQAPPGLFLEHVCRIL